MTDALHAISSSLQAPVIVLLIALAVVTVVVLGTLIAELFTERRYFKLQLPQFIDALDRTNDYAQVVREAGLLGRQRNALLELLSHPQASPADRESLAVNIVAQDHEVFEKRVKLTDLIAKVSPMLGLMGTLIPLGPGIVAIGAGDVETIAESLLVAFDTTVLGLVVAAVALCISTVRRAWYTQYNAAFEAACEVVLEKANGER